MCGEDGREREGLSPGPSVKRPGRLGDSEEVMSYEEGNQEWMASWEARKKKNKYLISMGQMNEMTCLSRIQIQISLTLKLIYTYPIHQGLANTERPR